MLTCPTCHSPLRLCHEGGGTGPTGDDPLVHYLCCDKCQREYPAEPESLVGGDGMLTVEELRSMRACALAIRAFWERWPSGQAPLRDVVLALAEHPQGIEWWNWLAGTMSALTPAYEVYYEIIHPAVETYLTAERCAAVEYVNLQYSNWEAYEAVKCPAMKVLLAVKRQAIRDVALLLPEEVPADAAGL